MDLRFLHFITVWITSGKGVVRVKFRHIDDTSLSSAPHKNYSENNRNAASRAVCHKPELKI